MTRSLVLSLVLLAGLPWLAQPAQAQSKGWQGSSILDDPEWRARFLGSYGFLSEVEPQIRPDELELLREVIDLMKVNPKAAATMLESQISPSSSAALDYILGNLHFQNGNVGEAGVAYQHALEKFPDFQRAHKNAGLLILQTEDYAGALTHLTRAVALGDRDGRTFGLIGYSYLNLENYTAAEEAYRSAVLFEPDSRDWKLGLARVLQAMDKNEEAVAHFASLIEADPGDPMAWKGQANAYLGLEKPREAAVDLEALRVMGEADASTLKLLGDIYMNEGVTELARDAYLEVIEKDAEGARFDTAYRAADLLVRTKAYRDARVVLDSIDKRYGKSLTTDQELEVLTLRARIARAEGNAAESFALLESIVARDGMRGDALLDLADYYNQRGDSARAFMYVERAQNIEAFEFDALVKHAQFRVDAKEYPKAAELLREALRIRQEPRIQRYLARVEQAAVGL